MNGNLFGVSGSVYKERHPNSCKLTRTTHASQNETGQDRRRQETTKQTYLKSSALYGTDCKLLMLQKQHIRMLHVPQTII
jgi:hypothetical protein